MYLALHGRFQKPNIQMSSQIEYNFIIPQLLGTYWWMILQIFHSQPNCIKKKLRATFYYIAVTSSLPSLQINAETHNPIPNNTSIYFLLHTPFPPANTSAMIYKEVTVNFSLPLRYSIRILPPN